MQVDVVGIPIQNVDMDEAVLDVVAFMEEKNAKIVVTPNAEILQMCIENEAVRDTVLQADYIVPDGIGVVKAAAMLGTPLKGKVAGCELGWNILEPMAKTGKKLFLLCGKPGVAELAAQKIKETYPTLEIAGIQDGYFKDDAAVIEMVNAANPDAMFVCLGAPKQENWMVSHRKELSVGVMLGLGGSMDVYAGTVKRAPKLFVKLGLEWFYRLIKQPWRIKRMMSLPRFFTSVKKYKKTMGKEDGKK